VGQPQVSVDDFNSGIKTEPYLRFRAWADKPDIPRIKRKRPSKIGIDSFGDQVLGSLIGICIAWNGASETGVFAPQAPLNASFSPLSIYNSLQAGQ
jgi:hypothetical protein